jgi:hypothetical protein
MAVINKDNIPSVAPHVVNNIDVFGNTMIAIEDHNINNDVFENQGTTCGVEHYVVGFIWLVFFVYMMDTLF